MQSVEQSTESLTARPGTYYRWTRYLISIGLLIGYGSFFIRDGFFVWPRNLQEYRDHERLNIPYHGEKPQSETAILINKCLGCTMPPLGIALLAWTLYNSRGQYRLTGHTLHVPGHPPVPLDSILKIDKTLWDRKGIAYIEYTPGEGQAPRTLKLDDFVYDQKSTDAILERIEQTIAPPELSEQA